MSESTQAYPLLPLEPDQRWQQLWHQGQRPDLGSFLAGAGELSPTQLLAVLLVDQRERWQKDARLGAEEYLALAPTLRANLEYTVQLIYGEFLLREELGETPALAEYVERFPAYAERLKLQIALHQALASSVVPDAKEALAPLSQVSTQRTGDRDSQHSGMLSSPTRIRCPHCHNPIQLVDERPDDVLCPACGGSFRVREARPTTTTDVMRPLGKFQLLQRVGVGAFGAVWRARDTELDRIVALKIPHASLLTSEADLERFHREARAAAQLRHPGIVTVHEVQTLEGLPTIVADFIEGVPLRDLLEVRRLTFREAATLLATVAEALDYAHAMGLVHRDIKPANIMMESVARSPQSVATDCGLRAMDQTLRPLVMDFGLALRQKAEVTLTLDGNIVGTPAYMSPEQAEGKGHQADRRSDIYSLGVVLYELLCGELPFRGSKMMMLYQVLHEEPRPARRLNDKIPRDLETICLKAMAKAPTRRYPTAGELAEDLRRFLADEPIRARPSGTGERVLKWARRRPAIASLLLLVFGVALAGFSGVLWQWHQAEAARQDAADKAAAEKQMRQAADEQRGQARAALTKAETTLYFNRTALAAQLWAANNVSTAEQMLDRCRPEQRGWEWTYLKHLCHADQRTLRDASGLLCVACSPDGQRLAAAGWMRTVRIWDADNGRELFTLAGHTREVEGLAYRPDGKHLASVGADGIITIWDPEAGRSLHAWTSHAGEIYGVAYSPDGQRLASAGDDGVVRIWDAASGNLQFVLEGHAGKVRAVAFTPDGRQLVSAHEGSTGKVRGVAFGPDGRQLVSADGDQGAILWDLSTRTPRFKLTGHGSSVMSVACHPDGKQLATASFDGIVRLWDVANGKETSHFAGHRNAINCIAYSQNGQLLATASWDRSVKLWSLAAADGLVRTLRGHTDAVYGVAFLSDGRGLISGSQDLTVKIWPLRESQECRVFRGHLGGANTIRYSPDGRHLASAGEDRTVRIWDVATGTSRITLEGHSANVCNLAFSPDGRRLASASEDHTVAIWDAVAGRKLFSFAGHDSIVSGVAFSPHGDYVASSDQHGLQVWRSSDGAVRFAHQQRLHAATVQPVQLFGGFDGVAFSPDGRLLAAAGGVEGQLGEIKIYDASTGTALRTLHGHGSRIRRVAFSPDGRLLASVSYDKTALIWDVASWREILTLTGHNDWVYDVAFSPDGTRLATASTDSTTKIWDLATGNETLTLAGHQQWVYSVAFSPDGNQLATSGEDGTIRLWDAHPPAPAQAEHWLLDVGTSGVSSLAFSPVSATLALACKEGRIRFWDTQEGWETGILAGHTAAVHSLAFSADGRRLATAAGAPNQPGEVKLWDVAAGLERATLSIEAPGGAVIAFLPEGGGLATVGADRITIWDETSGAVRAVLRRAQKSGDEKERFQIGAVSPDGKFLVAGSTTGGLQVWDMVSGRDFPLASKYATQVIGLAFTPDGRTLCSASRSEGVKLWDTTTWQESSRVQAGNRLSCLAIAPDGRTLAVGEWQGTVQLWDLRTAQRLGTLHGYSWAHPQFVRFSSDGRTLVVGSKDGTVMVWKIKPFESAEQPTP